MAMGTGRPPRMGACGASLLALALLLVVAAVHTRRVVARMALTFSLRRR